MGRSSQSICILRSVPSTHTASAVTTDAQGGSNGMAFCGTLLMASSTCRRRRRRQSGGTRCEGISHGGSAEKSADDSAPLLPGLAASANAPASSAEILGPLSAAMTGPPGEESKTGIGSNAATPSTSPNSEQKAEEPQKVSSTGEDAGNSVVRVMFREKSDTKLFERPDNNMDPDTSVVSFHGYHGVLVNPDDAPVSTGRAHLEDVKEVQSKPKEVSLTEDQKSAKASVNSDKGFKIVAAQKSTKPKRRLL